MVQPAFSHETIAHRDHQICGMLNVLCVMTSLLYRQTCVFKNNRISRGTNPYVVNRERRDKRGEKRERGEGEMENKKDNERENEMDRRGTGEGEERGEKREKREKRGE